MPTDTPDQQITLPVGADAADNPVAFTNAIADIERRLVREYVNEADRTARRLIVSPNEISSLAAEGRLDVWDGSADISLFSRSLFALKRKAASQTLLSNTTLTNDNTLFVALPTAGTFGWRCWLLYNSSLTADIKLTYTWPAGATATWSGMGLASTATGTSGDINMAAVTVSGTTLVFGGAAANSVILLEGEIVMGGTAGNLQLQWAQNTSDATNTSVLARSRMMVWRSL